MEFQTMSRKLVQLGLCLVALAMSAAAQVTGSGSANQIPVFTGTSTISGNSNITSVNGNVGIGTTSPGALLDVSGGGANIDVHGSYNANLSLIPSGTGAQTYIISAQGAGASLPAGQLDFYDQTTNTNVMALSGGNVGIGTTNPQALLYIVSGLNELGFTPSGSLLSNGGNGSILSNRFTANGNSHAEAARIELGLTDGSSGYNAGSIGFLTAPDTGGNPAVLTRMYISQNGNVGIGTVSPGAALEVNGTALVDNGLYFPGSSTPQTQPWTGVLCGGDYAEAVDASGDRKHYEPGDVLILASEGTGEVEKSDEPYSTLVAGIYATRPGAIGRRQTLPESADEVPMAMVGIVPTKVTTENGPIRRGDLLVSSSKMGYAMKGTDRSRMLGAVLGKAMGSLDAGTGVIEVLVTLQ
jgi:hypothetical protein